VGRHIGERSNEVELMLTSGAIYILRLKYDGYATYFFQPTALDFGAVDLDNDEDATQSVVFSSTTARVTSDIVVDSAWLQVGRHERSNEETEIAVHVSKRNLPHGKNYARVTVRTTDPFKPEFSFRVSAEGVSEVRAIPGHLFLKPRREGMVRFVDADGRAVRIGSVDAELPGFNVVKRPGNSSLSLTYMGDGRSPDDAAVFWMTTESGIRCRFLVSVVD